MELNGYRLLLPEGTLDYFDLVDVKESLNEVVIYLEEKNQTPEKYAGQETEGKVFYEPVIVQDFPLRGKKVFLNLLLRRWILKSITYTGISLLTQRTGSCLRRTLVPTSALTKWLFPVENSILC